MKTIRNITIRVGLSAVLFALAATGVRAQVVQGASTINFAGTFTLPNDAKWGTMALPAGNYTLNYANRYGSYFVEVRGTAKGSPHGRILAGPLGQTSATKNAIVCMREGDTLVVRALELSAIGESIQFAPPHGTKLVAQQRNDSTNTQIAQAPMLIQRIPVKPSAE